MEENEREKWDTDYFPGTFGSPRWWKLKQTVRSVIAKSVLFWMSFFVPNVLLSFQVWFFKKKKVSS